MNKETVLTNEFDLACEAFIQRSRERHIRIDSAELLIKDLGLSAKKDFDSFAVLYNSGNNPEMITQPLVELQMGLLESVNRLSILLEKDKLFTNERFLLPKEIGSLYQTSPFFKQGYLSGLVYIEAYWSMSMQTIHKDQNGIPPNEFVSLLASLQNVAMGNG